MNPTSPVVLASAFSPSDWLIVLVVVVLLFGGSQIPKLARSLGQAQKEFKAGQDEAGSSTNGSGKPERKDDDGNTSAGS